MPYLNTDDEFPEHPKVDELSDGAFRLHVSGMHYCARNLSDGIIPGRKVSRLKPEFKRQQLDELLAGGVWHEGGRGCGTPHCPVGAPGEYVVHDFLQWNKDRAWWEAERARKAKNKADWKARQQQEREHGLLVVRDR